MAHWLAAGALRRRGVPNGIYHVTTRGNDGWPIFMEPADRRIFLSLVLRIARRRGWTLHASCLMTNHFHLVVEVREPDLSAGMQEINGRYAQMFNHRHGRSGHLFGGRFSSKSIEGDTQYAATLTYVLMNPVRAGLVTRPEDWPWTWSRFGTDSARSSSTAKSKLGSWQRRPSSTHAPNVATPLGAGSDAACGAAASGRSRKSAVLRRPRAPSPAPSCVWPTFPSKTQRASRPASGSSTASLAA